MSDLGKFYWKSHTGAILIAAVVAFLFTQAFIAAHAAKYGDSPHEHGAQVCVLSLVAPGSDKVVGSASFVLIMIAAAWGISFIVVQCQLARIQVRAARPRGPPSR